MDLSNKNTMLQILADNGFSFKKSLGQNFLIDSTVCPRMADASVSKDTSVIEIGPGAGILTVELCKRAKKVVAVELDERLKPVLQHTTGGYDNLEIVFGDILKLDLKEIISNHLLNSDHICICANLPYYVTSPVIMHLLKSKLPVESITVMVQKEAADRICAKVGGKKSGAITVAVNYYSKAEKLFDVPKSCFYPSPKVDSSVIKLIVNKEPAVKINSEDNFFKLSRALFAQRRKTLINTVSNTLSIDKEKIRDALYEMGLDGNIRGESLSIEQIAELSDKIFKAG